MAPDERALKRGTLDNNLLYLFLAGQHRELFVSIATRVSTLKRYLGEYLLVAEVLELRHHVLLIELDIVHG